MKRHAAHLSVWFSLALVGFPGVRAVDAKELLPDPGFAQATAADRAQGWDFPNFMTPAQGAVVSEGGNTFLRFTNGDVTKVVGMQKTVDLPAGTKFVIVSAKFRVKDVQLGKDGWHEPRIAMRFQDAKGEGVGGYPAVRQRENTDWKEVREELEVPEGAVKLNLQPGLWLCGGTLDIDEISVQAFPGRMDYLRSKVAAFDPAFAIGAFEQVDAGGKPKGWEVPPQMVTAAAEESTAVKTNQHPENNFPGTAAQPAGRVLALKTDGKGDVDARAVTQFAVDPSWQEVKVTFKMKAQELRLGPEIRAPQATKWRQAGALVTFLGADGKEMTDGSGLYVRHPRDWTEFAVSAGVPEGAVVCKVELGTWWAGGTVYYDDVRVTPGTEVRYVDAKLPENRVKEYEQKAAVAVAEQRGEVDLNGIWKFVQASGATLKEPRGFGYIKVPGAWNRDDSIVQRGEGKQWLMFKGSEVAQAWYEKTITVPADWAGRAVVLDIDRVSTDAVVYLDGKEMGQVAWPAGQVDLTAGVKPGTAQQLRIRVLAVDNKTEVVSYMGYVNEPKSKAELQTRGIIGKGVKLVSRPRGTYVYDVAIRPSTRGKKLDVEVELGGAEGGQVEIAAEAVDEQGKVEKSFPAQQVDLSAAKDSPTVLAKGIKSVLVSWPWENPRLWDYKQPNTYTLRLSVKSVGGQDVIAQRFGFREWWIDGRQFYFNNTPYNLRPQNLDYGAMPAGQMAEKYNFGELWPNDRGRRGSETYDDKVIEEADRIGFPVAGKGMHMADYATKIREFAADPNLKAEWRRLMELDLRRWRNCPSVVMWAHTSNVFQNNGDGDPRELGMKGVSNQQEQFVRNQNVWELIRMMKELDPTRPVYAHHGSDHGEVYTSNFYLNFTPLQEREEWMAYWAKNGQIPFIAIEFGTPLYSSMNRDKDGYTHQGHSEPSLTEWMAVYLGPEAYALEPKEYRRIFLERYQGLKADFRDEYQPHLRHNRFDEILWKSPSFVKFQNLWYRNTWRSWRTMGVAGMGIPWHQADPKSFPELTKNNDETLAWIGGPEGETGSNAPTDPTVPNFTRKDHNFAPGQTVRKQLVFINDARSEQPVTWTWTAMAGGKQLGSGDGKGTLQVGEKRFVPVEFVLPETASVDLTQGAITLKAKIGEAEHSDEFALTVIGSAAKASGTLVAFDPVGDSTKYLQGLGYTVKPWSDGAPSGDLVIIGRNALSDRHVLPAGLEAYLANGARVVVFEQDREWLKLSLQLRTAEHVSRRAFRVSSNHPVTFNLGNANLADWSGEGTAIASHPYYPGLEWTNYYGWHWGNRGSVSSAMIEMPHRSSLRPILVGEFDLAYSPLMEMEYGKGRLVLCTLDLENRKPLEGKGDPAADKLATQLIEYVRTAPIAAKADPKRVVYVGDEKGAKVLDDLGVLYTTADAVAPDTQLAIVGDGVELAAVRPLLERGGKALFLARDAGKGPRGITVELKKDVQGSIRVPEWPECAGLSPADLHWKTVYEGRVITAAAEGAEIGADGMLARMQTGDGVAIFAQVDPTYLPADKLHYFRFTRWRQTRALSQLLSNLGATFRQDGELVRLIERPLHGWTLAGEWEVQLTNSRKESPLRQWNSDPGMTERAKQLLVLGPGEGEGWQKVSVPAYMESYKPAETWRWADGECVFRKVIDVPEYMAGKDMYLSVGRVDEWEKTYINGQFVAESHSWLVPRGHKIPGKLIKPGKNVIALRTWDEGIHGGLGGPRETYFLRVDAPAIGFYHPDYLPDLPSATDEKEAQTQFRQWNVADNPYRYTRW